MHLRGIRLCCSFLLAAGISIFAKEPQEICGTVRGSAREELFLHRQSMRGRRPLALSGAARAATGKDIGDIAVMYDTGLVSRRNQFNLEGRTITFTPAAEGTPRYAFRTSGPSFDDDAAQSGAVVQGLTDDDTRRLDLPFSFPFFGKTHTRFFLNSDGNLSFEDGDSASVTKTVGLLSSGPPRIAPLMTDLDPSKAPNAIRVVADSSRLVVSWFRVPSYQASGTGPLQTFQARLYPDGRIEFAYGGVTAREAVVGIAPGRAAGTTEVLSFTAGSDAEFAGTVAERFTNSELLDPVLVSQRFYETHEDAYDYIAVYNTVGVQAQPFALAIELTVRSRFRRGIGDIEVDVGSAFGSRRRLQAFLNMGPMTQYPVDPLAAVPLRGGTGDTSLSILAHETGHLFLALASIRDEADPDARPMLGAGNSHWSFNFNSDASFLEGNRIEDRGEGASPRFATVATVEHYSALDQYLMGFRPRDEVPPMFLVQRSGFANDVQPRRGVTFGGVRRNIPIEEIIGAEGRRAPDNTVAQRRFRMAVVLLVREGTEPAPGVVDQLDMLRSRFEAYFARGTDDRASMETALRRNLQLSLGPASGVLAGATVTGAISLDHPAEADLTVALKGSSGVAKFPQSVTIPAGAVEVRFPVAGLTAGVEEITAEPSDGAYRIDYARLRVLDSREELKMEVVGGDQQVGPAGEFLEKEVEIRVSDVNLIPYAGIAVAAQVAGGSVEPATAVTGADGIARFRWKPVADLNELRAVIEGSSVSATATAVGM